MTVSALLVSGCSGITLKDSVWCGSLASEGAACAHTMTAETQRMTISEFAAWWDDLSDPKVATSIATLTEWKADIEKLCTVSGACTAEVQAEVQTVFAKISQAHKAAVKTATIRAEHAK